jgi:nucleoside-diphosphate-sugar epimerase
VSCYLVTGATGFIGRRVCERLRETARVRATSRNARMPGPWDEAVVSDLSGIADGIVAGVDAVVHVAGVAHLHGAALDDDAAYAFNVEGTRHVCEAARRAGVRRVVLVSSVAVLGEHGCFPEDATPAPATAYARSKLAAERIVLATAAEPVVLRLPLVYGPGLPGNLARMVASVRTGRFPPIPRVRNRRSMVHVDDVAAAVALAVCDARAPGRAYTVTDGRAYSTPEIVDWIVRALGRRPRRATVPAAAFRLAARVGDAYGRVAGRRALFDGAAYRKLLGSAEYESGAIVAELGFVPAWDLERAMPSIVAAPGP